MADSLLPSDSPEGEQVLQDYYKSTTPRAYFHSAMPFLADYVDPPPLSHYQATTPIEQQGEKIPPTEPGTLPGALLDVVQATGLPELKGPMLAGKTMLGMAWAPEEVTKLKNLVARNYTQYDIAKELGRAQGTISAKMRDLGIKSKFTPGKQRPALDAQGKVEKLPTRFNPYTGTTYTLTPVDHDPFK